MVLIWTGTFIPKGSGLCPVEYTADNGCPFFHPPEWGKAFITYRGGTTEKRFVQYLKEILGPVFTILERCLSGLFPAMLRRISRQSVRIAAG
jgi:hypothetical protein